MCPPLLVPPNWDSGLLGEGFRCRFLQTAKGYCNENSLTEIELLQVEKGEKGVTPGTDIAA